MLTPVSSGVFAQTDSVRVVCDQTLVYSAPDITSETLMTATYGTEFSIVSDEVVDYKLFYKISLVGHLNTPSEGYILKAHTLNSEISSPKMTLSDNAWVKSETAVVYNLVGEEFVDTGITLGKDTKIRVLNGYDQSKTYTHIAFVKDDNIVYYYLKTADIGVSGINYLIIVAIMTLITCACALSIVFGLKAKKKKKAKANKNK